MQQVRAAQERNRNYRAVVFRADKRFVQLATPDLPTVNPGEDPVRTLGTSDIPYQQQLSWDQTYNDVYLVDMERVEILEGPQGTLFGGGAQAGAIRYITNKPKLGITGGDVNAAYGVTAGGDPNTTVNATLNLPFGDSFALRGVIFSERRGGYIDNVATEFTADAPWLTIGPSTEIDAWADDVHGVTTTQSSMVYFDKVWVG